MDRQREPLPTRPDLLPPLPTGYRRALDLALEVLGVALSPEAERTIDAHVRLLLAWNDAINLTAIVDPEKVATLHVADSLAALPLLTANGTSDGGASRRRAADGAGRGAAAQARAMRIVDLGSGGGFPGLPLAAALPAARVTLVESVGKKARFLATAVEACGLGARVNVRAARAESLATDEPARADVVTARAVGSLPELVELAMPLLAVGGRLIAWKRDSIEDELAAAGRAARSLGCGVPSRHPVRGVPSLEGHVLVEIAKVAPTPPGFPRDPAARRRRSW